jgi:serine/threonine protein kinase
VGPGRQEWILEQFLGMGAFGEVWLGCNPLFPEQRAFKFFTREGAKDWVQREQQTLFQIRARLRGHPNIIQFEDVAIGGQPWPFLMLEYVAGGSLEDWIVAHPQDRSPLDPFEVVAGISRGLAKAHAEKIYHRDLKPANILLTSGADVQAKIADFGLGKAERGPGGGSSVQVSQALVIGTQMYLPPEANDPYEPRSPAQDDVFALGVIWYQLLVGRLERPPYDFIDQLRQRGTDSATVERIARCFAHPQRRFADAGELLESLDERPPITWSVPDGCFDVGHLASEYLHTQRR